MTSFERKVLPNGRKNPHYIDLLDEDPPLAGQKFACFSFLSPEKLLQKREHYLFEQFVKQYDYTTSMGKFNDFLNFLSYKYHLKPEGLQADFKEFVETEEETLRRDAASHVETSWRNFLDKDEERLTHSFQAEHGFQTSTRGLKLRGVFGNQEEAERHCTKLRERDPHHDILVGQVGVWMPWDPDAYKTGRVEFMEEELNQLHKEKIKNEERAKQEFEQRVRETKRKAIEENIAKARASGNVLTQTIDPVTDELVGVTQRVQFDEREAASEEGLEANRQAAFDGAKGEEK